MVVAIIALLISVLLPSLKAARDLAKLTACKAGMHELGTGMHVYANESNPWFPVTPGIGSSPDDAGFPAGDDNTFVLYYRKYVRNADVWNCPAKRYRVRLPEKVEKKPSVNGVKYELTTAGMVDRNEFEEKGQLVINRGFGTSYEYNPWYSWYNVDLTIKKTKVDWYGALAPFEVSGSIKTLETTFPAPAVAFLMHEADEGGDVIGSNGAAENNVPEPWDNHGTRAMDMVFADNHTESIPRRMLDDPVLGSILWNRQSRYDH